MSIKFHTLRREQWISRPIDEVFAFFSDAHNLEEITPPWLGFRILSSNAKTISEGTELRYRLRLHGIPIHWRTEIRQWDVPNRFVDVQRSGPYRLWHHTHRFEEHGGRTKMIDVVRYSLPFGILGRMIHALKIRGDVRRIFDYRRQRIHELFGPEQIASLAHPPSSEQPVPEGSSETTGLHLNRNSAPASKQKLSPSRHELSLMVVVNEGEISNVR